MEKSKIKSSEITPSNYGKVIFLKKRKLRISDVEQSFKIWIIVYKKIDPNCS